VEPGFEVIPPIELPVPGAFPIRPALPVFGMFGFGEVPVFPEVLVDVWASAKPVASIKAVPASKTVFIMFPLP
jgi:hypothetical protein